MAAQEIVDKKNSIKIAQLSDTNDIGDTILHFALIKLKMI
jgi:hypothetical protein